MAANENDKIIIIFMNFLAGFGRKMLTVESCLLGYFRRKFL
jgi:hypothetical protein